MIIADGRTKDYAHIVARSANGRIVYAELTQTPLASNISRTPHLLRLAEEAVADMELTAADIEISYDMGRSIGYCERIDTNDSDAVFYARQSKTAAFTRFVKNRQTVATQHISMHLQLDSDGNYKLCNVWFGSTYPALPGDVEESSTSKSYWSSHAVVFNGQAVIASTLTRDCPY